MKTKMIFLFIILAFILLLSCNSTNTKDILNSKDENILKNVSGFQDSSIDTIKTYNSSQKIELNNESIIIKWAWTYEISWKIDDWQLLVDVPENNEVILKLNWAEISNSKSSAIYVKSGNITIYLEKWSKNIVSDWKNHSNSENDYIDSTIFVNGNLTINWEWNLTINSNFQTAIISKDNLTINNWNLDINSAWDWLKSDNWIITINDWIFSINSEKQWIQSHSSIIINNWDINIWNSSEWMEAEQIIINNWKIKIKSTDDWLNTSSNWWTDIKMIINWWIIEIDSQADWLDSNWDIELNWWKVIINWPTEKWNWAIDYDWIFKITLWEIIAFWSSSMSMNASSDSKQNSVLINLNSEQKSGTKFSLKDSAWNLVYEVSSTKSFSSIMFSADFLEKGDYIYELNWVNTWNFTISSTLTNVGNSRWMWRWPSPI